MFVRQNLWGSPAPLFPSIISSPWLMTFEPPERAGFDLTVLCTISETCRVCDAVMDTLKKVTPSRFSTLPTLCWTEKGILTSPRIISMLSCFSIWGSYIFQRTIFGAGNPAREHCLLPPRNDPSTVSAHFFQTFQEISRDLNISVRLCIVPVPHLTIYCCWLDQQGGVVIGVTVLKPEPTGLDSLWQPKSTLLRCPSARFPSSYRDAALKRCGSERH